MSIFIHEDFHILVVETFDEVGMTVQDADSQECIPMFDSPSLEN